LQGGCQAPIGGYAVLKDGRIHLRAFVAELDGSVVLRAEAWGDLDDPEAVGLAAAQQLFDQGAEALMAKLIAPPQ